MAVDHHQTGLWVFGYGSLCWNPGFDYECCLVGCVRGWSRKFWQGNTTHRGTEGKPGRVATMVQEKEGEVWGCAFLVRGEAALPYLKDRECDLGGYRTLVAKFEPRRADRPAFPVLLYVATPDNRHWLGDAPLPDMARHIASSSGASGHNVEYVLRLAQFVRTAGLGRGAVRAGAAGGGGGAGEPAERGGADGRAAQAAALLRRLQRQRQRRRRRRPGSRRGGGPPLHRHRPPQEAALPQHVGGRRCHRNYKTDFLSRLVASPFVRSSVPRLLSFTSRRLSSLCSTSEIFIYRKILFADN
ncbi:putative glutathione-specific gamma-glutamylcyclotransferase 2 isoform X1 [Schistocerca gregaria]|uniref:putative glutathione-specific gamma-glutamylcyclotransferase 2 isoform X1 n=1 Tax=Schistocerca gregaria TaxID=7010 RepID=UPI00211E5794|nr:putative glutathione-specific gamma-glutamylcyclotransferase 2 isoform X1 [Schistocerca gregaria]